MFVSFRNFKCSNFSLFRSKLCLVLNGFLQKVETKQHVDMVRKNILVDKILLIKEQTVLSVSLGFYSFDKLF